MSGGQVSDTGGLALPMVTWLDSEAGWGLSLAISPEDHTIYNRLTTPAVEGRAPKGFAAHEPGYWSNGVCYGPSTVPKQHPPCKPWHPTTIQSCATLCNASDACRAFEVYGSSATAQPKYCWLFMDQLTGFKANSNCKAFVKNHNASVHAVTNRQYSFARTGSRFTHGVGVNLTTLLVLHEPDWRPALAALRDTFTEYFYANETVDTSTYDGLMAYADYRGDVSSGGGGPTGNTSIPFETLEQIGMRTNWDASFPFQGGGFWLGPGTPHWTTCYPHPDNPVPSSGPRACRKTSYAQIEAAYSLLRAQAGVSTLAYGNLYMFGALIEPFDSPTNFTSACMPLPVDDYQRINCSLNLQFRSEFKSAALYDSASGKQIVYAGYGLAVVDPAEPHYRRFIVEQHQKQVSKTPSIVGVAFDEQQYLGNMNTRRDDGIAWFDGKPAASLLRSFIDVTADIATQVMHPSGRGLLVNPHVYRLDMFRQLDGILDEFGDDPVKMVTSSILGLAMPVLAWDHCGGNVASQKLAASCAKRCSMDDFLSQHLYLGVQPMGPMVNQSHGVLPSALHLQYFCDWAPLFKAIRGKQWFLTSHAVTTTKTKSNNSSANQTTPKVNMFAVDSENFAQYSYAIPVVMAGANASPVSVIIGMLHGVSWKMVTAVALLPGVAAPVGLALRELDDQRAVLTTPRLKRGAALCLLKIEQPAVDPSMGVLRSMNGTA